MDTPPPQPPQEPVPPQGPLAPPEPAAPPAPVEPVAQPAAPAPQPVVAAAVPSGPSIRFEAIGQAFNMIFADAGTWIVAALFVLIPVILLWIVINVVLLGLFIAGAGLLAPVFQILGSAVVMAVSYILLANMYRMAIKALSGLRPSVNEMFLFGKDMSNVILAGIVVGLLTGIGFIFCAIPGLIFGGLAMFTLPLVVDRQMPAMDALSKSIDTLKKDWPMAALFFLCAYVCSIVPLGLTMAVMPISVAILYRDYIGFANIDSAEPVAPAP